MKKIFYILLGFGLLHSTLMAFEPKEYQMAWNQLLKHPQELKTFIDGMPIGADLHCHASGAVRTEALVNIAKENHYCIDKHYQLSHPVGEQCVNAQFTDKLLKIPYYQQKTIQAWSMEQFRPNQKEDNKTHFFKTFEKFDFLPKENWPKVVAEVVNQAHHEHVQYLELMLSMQGVAPLTHLSPKDHHIEDVLHHPEYKAYIQSNIEYFKNLKKRVHQLTPWLGEDVDISWILEIKRNQAFDKFWVDAVMAFAITNQVPDILAVNLVQPEYAKYAKNDYSLQMKFLKILKLYYPRVKIVIHAGELPSDIAQHSKVQHIKMALEDAQPTRIGHGTMILYEKDYQNTLKALKDKDIPVEINLTSNDQILNVKANNHPLKVYLQAAVPVVISSDDPGISRNRLSHEYLRAIREHNLSLDQIIRANRNSLSYSLLPGQSIWKDNQYNSLVHHCQSLKSKQCIDFISKNPKAYQQWVLENDLDLYFANHLHKIVHH
jgi:adenosine deaminase